MVVVAVDVRVEVEVEDVLIGVVICKGGSVALRYATGSKTGLRKSRRKGSATC